MKISSDGSDGIVKVWRKPNKVCHSNCMGSTIKYREGSIMILGSMSGSAVGTMAVIDEIIAAEST